MQDDTRHWKISGEDSEWKEEYGPMSNYFASINRNKKSITLNLKATRGRDIFMSLIKDADVVYV